MKTPSLTSGFHMHTHTCTHKHECSCTRAHIPLPWAKWHETCSGDQAIETGARREPVVWDRNKIRKRVESKGHSQEVVPRSHQNSKIKQKPSLKLMANISCNLENPHKPESCFPLKD